MIRKIFFSLYFILAITLLLRVVFLDKVPTGASNDEIDYILNAKSVFLSGSDISHTWNPLTFTTPKSSFPQAEIAPLVTFWIIGLLPLSLFTSKLVYALFATGTVGLIYLITKKLIGEKEAFVVGLVGAFNPWLIFFGRTAYDTSLAVFFFLLALYLLLVLKGWKILLVFPVLCAAFYAYIGTKLLLLPFVMIVILFTWWGDKKYIKQYLALFILSFTLFSCYAFSITHTPGTRLSELARPNMSQIAATVNMDRQLSIHSPITPFLSNKYVVFGKYALDKYLNAFSPSFLFLHGDEKAQFTLWNHGVFYYADIIFLLIGFAVLFAKSKKALLLLSALIFIAPIPSVVSTVGNSYAIRSMLLAPPFIMLIGVGIYYVVRKYRFGWVPISIVYSFLLLNFFNIYFMQNPLYNSESFSFSGRELATYLSFQTDPVYVINTNPKTPFKEYIFYNNILNGYMKDQIARDYKSNTFIIHNIHFITCQQVAVIPEGSVIIYDNCKRIPFSKNDLAIAQLRDGGTIYTIKNDSICSKYSLQYYPRDIAFSDLHIEKLSPQVFCEKFISKF